MKERDFHDHRVLSESGLDSFRDHLFWVRMPLRRGPRKTRIPSSAWTRNHRQKSSTCGRFFAPKSNSSVLRETVLSLMRRGIELRRPYTPSLLLPEVGGRVIAPSLSFPMVRHIHKHSFASTYSRSCSASSDASNRLKTLSSRGELRRKTRSAQVATRHKRIKSLFFTSIEMGSLAEICQNAGARSLFWQN